MEFHFPTYRSPSCIDNAYSFEQVFTQEECENIKILGDSLLQVDGASGGGVNKEYRTSKISWIKPTDKIGDDGEEGDDITAESIYARLTNYINHANSEAWQFNIDGFREQIQYTRYDYDEKETGKFLTHMDIGSSNPNVNRKISVVVQLSDPDDYEGGELQIYRGVNPVSARQEQGSVILFPSYMLHGVTPLTSGKRRSLVVWVSGEPFR